MGAYEAVIGMEVHSELLTQSKMFCGCCSAFGGEPNTRCCPVCTGMPGSLPVMNRAAVEHVIRAALALNCTINPIARFDRKNYYYPDLPKGYQISEYDSPIGINGWLDIETADGPLRVHIRRVHLEEDTGKLFHLAGNESAVDYNRSGVPLMEIVTEFPPDMHTADQARAYLVKLRSILTYIGVSDGKMEEGSLRCEPNLSVRPFGSAAYGTKTEIKNLNSFRSVHRGVDYEIRRQSALLDRGERVGHETRGWNEAKGETFSQRSKELEQEYRYFPEPDLVPLRIDDVWVERIRATMPELPDVACARFQADYGLPAYDAGILTQSRETAAYFEEAARACGDAKSVANWLIGDFARLLNMAGIEIRQSRVRPGAIATLVELIARGEVSGKMAKSIFERMFETGDDPADIARAEGPQISDAGALSTLIDAAIAEQAQVWQSICAGDERKLPFLIGQVMKASRGKANPQEANRLLRERLTRDTGRGTQ